MDRKQLLGDIRETLVNAGFYVSDIYSMRPVGFDLVARRDNSLLIVKALINIDALSEDVARELKVLSDLLQGVALLIGERSGTGLLEEGVVYDRFGINSISSETLENYLLEGIPLEVYAAPGGLYVNLDREKLKKVRHEQSISLGSFARSIHVSRRTASMYEDGMNARVDVAYRMEGYLGAPIIQPIDILEVKEKNKSLPLDSKKSITVQVSADRFETFKNEIFSILKNVGYKIIPMERCPFEAVSKNKERVLLTCVHRYDKKLLRKAQFVTSISKVTEKHGVLITDKEVQKTNIEGTPLIFKEELKRIFKPEEMLELILERI
jgi:putative transcriptional regulator